MSSNRQSVNVIVNNKISSCCEKKKKRKRPRKKEAQEEPQTEFPAMNTPAARQGATYIPSGVPNRNVVYIPSGVQISPEGTQPPVPSYFERHYTNLTRTIEDMRESLMKRINDVHVSMRLPSGTNNPVYDPTVYDPALSVSTFDDPIFDEALRTQNVPQGELQENDQIKPQIPVDEAEAGPSHTSYSNEKLMNMKNKKLQDIYNRLYPERPKTLPKKILYVNAILEYQNISRNGIPSGLLSGI